MKTKIRRRYLALKIDSNEKFSSKEFMDTVWDTLLRLYGEYGASKAGLALIDYNTDKGIAITRAAHTETEKLRAAIASITEIAAKPAAVHVLTVSGTLKTLRRKIRTLAF
ncbi:MAG: Rpp14/Pop5 family protein [Candidatus Bathyarchaeia archaeon]